MSVKLYRLPKAFAEKWIEALRSGEYSQGWRRLHKTNGGFCCLGVACVIQGIPVDKLLYKSVINSDVIGYEYVPKELIGDIRENDLVTQLTRLNDDGQHDFNQIASWIEENVEFYEEEVVSVS